MFRGVVLRAGFSGSFGQRRTGKAVPARLRYRQEHTMKPWWNPTEVALITRFSKVYLSMRLALAILAGVDTRGKT